MELVRKFITSDLYKSYIPIYSESTIILIISETLYIFRAIAILIPILDKGL